MQTAKQSSLHLLNHIFYTSGSVREPLNKTQMKLPITAEKWANFCSLYLCKLLSALCTSNINLAQKQHTEKMSAAVSRSEEFEICGEGKKGCFYFCQSHAEACQKGHSRSVVRPKWTINFLKNSGSSTLKQSRRQQSSQTSFQMYKSSFTTQKVPTKKV